MKLIITKKLSKFLEGANGKKYITDALEATQLIVLNEYKKQTPMGFTGELKGQIKVIKMGALEYKVTTTATNKGKPYPIYIHEGTGKLKEAGDYGYTSGYTRAGTVAKGIGGIRPNKFATRTVEAKKDDVKNFMIKTLRPYL
jgi:V8-like Glu-specific endopeptidase